MQVPWMLKKKIELLLRSFNFKTFIFAVTKTLSHTDFETGKKRNSYLIWGKYQEREGKLMMPLAGQVHHAFVGGIHTRKPVYIGVFNSTFESLKSFWICIFKNLKQAKRKNWVLS